MVYWNITEFILLISKGHLWWPLEIGNEIFDLENMVV